MSKAGFHRLDAGDEETKTRIMPRVPHVVDTSGTGSVPFLRVEATFRLSCAAGSTRDLWTVEWNDRKEMVNG